MNSGNSRRVRYNPPMRVSGKDLFDKLGVGHIMGPYETCPWSAHDGEKGITCSAEVRMGPDGEEVECEAQLMYDTPPAGKSSMEQVAYLRAGPSAGQWEVTTFRVRGKPYQDKGGWEMKSCDFIAMLGRALQAGEIPDIDELLEEAFTGRDKVGGGGAGGGGRAVKMKPQNAVQMKRGR